MSFLVIESRNKCLLRIRLKDQPVYWYAYHKSLPILAKDYKTVWSIEVSSLPFVNGSLSIKVEQSLDKDTIGQYFCIEDRDDVHLCSPNQDSACKFLIVCFMSSSFPGPLSSWAVIMEPKRQNALGMRLAVRVNLGILYINSSFLEHIFWQKGTLWTNTRCWM